MNKETLEAFAREAAKGIKTEQDLNDFRQMHTEVTVEHALDAELDDHLDYEKYEPSENTSSRNGSTVRRYVLKMDNLNSLPPGIAKAALNLSLSKKVKLALPQWTTRFYFYMPKA